MRETSEHVTHLTQQVLHRALLVLQTHGRTLLLVLALQAGKARAKRPLADTPLLRRAASHQTAVRYLLSELHCHRGNRWVVHDSQRRNEDIFRIPQKDGDAADIFCTNKRGDGGQKSSVRSHFVSQQFRIRTLAIPAEADRNHPAQVQGDLPPWSLGGGCHSAERE